MNYHVEYIYKDNYLIRKFTGDINFQAVLNSWQYLVEHDLGKEEYIGIINDFSDASMKMELEELQQLLNYFKLNSEIFKKLKLAVIMTTPENVVFPIFAQKISNFNIKAFSSLKSAEDWILFE